MNDNLKFFAGLSAISALKWSAVFIPGLLLTFIFALIVGFQSSDVLPGNASGHAGGSAVIAYLVALASTNPCAFIVLIGSPLFIVSYATVANKAAIQRILSGIWENRAVHLVEPAVKRIVDTFVSKSTFVQKTFSTAGVRAGLLGASRKDPQTSGITKHVINYAFKKIDLQETELNNELSLGDIISARVSAYITDAAKPGFGLFWILLAIHVALFIGAQVLNT